MHVILFVTNIMTYIMIANILFASSWPDETFEQIFHPSTTPAHEAGILGFLRSDVPKNFIASDINGHIQILAISTGIYIAFLACNLAHDVYFRRENLAVLLSFGGLTKLDNHESSRIMLDESSECSAPLIDIIAYGRCYGKALPCTAFDFDLNIHKWYVLCAYVYNFYCLY